MEYVLHVAILVLIYIILTSSLNLISGYTGLISVGHAAFFGVGAYTAALLAINTGLPWFLSLLSATAVAAIFGIIVGVPSLRIRDDYFVIATFAFQLVTVSILTNWVSLTGGPAGLPGIPWPKLGSLSILTPWAYLMLTALICVLTLWVIFRLVHSPFGRLLKAIREDEIFASAVGKKVSFCKIIVFVIGAAIAGIAGTLYAQYVSFIDPTIFSVSESIFMLSIVISGGAGSFWGPIVGAIVLVTLPEALRFVGLPGLIGGNVRQIIYGMLLIGFMLWRPQGLFGEYAFKKETTSE